MKLSILCVAAFLSGLCAHANGPFLANGLKVGEVDQNSALVWVRLTEEPVARFDPMPILTQGLKEGEPDEGLIPEDLVPGSPGRARVSYWLASEGPAAALQTDWELVSPERDYIHQFRLKGLKAGERYQYKVEARPLDTEGVSASMTGQFTTPPAVHQRATVRFIVTTCQAVRSIDSGREGHYTYQQMLAYNPDFLVHTGDIVYYDKAPLAKNLAQARSKWNIMFSYGHNQYFHRHVTSYFMKDDHDTLVNDCWPGQSYGDLSFAQGLEIFREQVPMGERTYRTYRWGKHVQIWMTENRDFRSPNTMPDGPEKTILGAEQKAWLMRTVQESDATYKFIISPGPMVGPDKRGKKDNHANEAFAHEGQELRDFIAAQPNTYVICGDRHWQYCSQDPQTGVWEFGCGPINDQHTFGGNPGYHPGMHRFFSGKGGFMGVTVENGRARVEWFGADEDFPEAPIPVLRHREVLPAVRP